MRLKIEINGLAVLDCEVMDLMTRMGMASGFPFRLNVGDHVSFIASNKQMMIADHFVKEADPEDTEPF